MLILRQWGDLENKLNSARLVAKNVLQLFKKLFILTVQKARLLSPRNFVTKFSFEHIFAGSNYKHTNHN